MAAESAVFIDTSAWYAAAAAGDRHNARAKALLQAHPRRITTDHVAVETWRLLAHRLGWSTAERWLRALRDGIATIEHVTAVDVERAVAIGETFADQALSLVDRTSFSLMERLGHHRAIAFDDDFAIYRFGPMRDRAFTVIR